MPVINSNHSVKQTGFTLIEMIVGIVIFGIALSLVTTLIFPQARRSVDPIMQVRATELAGTLLREISAKAFDENSRGSIRCNDDLNADGDFNDAGEIACTAASDLGPEPGESRTASQSNFDDVDDYNGLVQGAGQADPIIRNSLGEVLVVDGQTLYAGFSVSVSVVYDGNMDGVADINQTAKLITVNVNTPGGETLQFARYRSNY
ncbi:type II secretion system protein [Aliiglaciecola litoralis]|uniref:Prepilin-type N-terminal cleavage/methylation domain-containing protein n=1 Tax=Aliiglaciecola litoralis TaxID=582857 RepID=A0ABN1LIR4_9ALTE